MHEYVDTKHMNIRYKDVNEYVEEDIVTLVFVKSTNNNSDILTKNLNADLHQKHSNKMLGEKL